MILNRENAVFGFARVSHNTSVIFCPMIQFLGTETSPQEPLKRAQFGVTALGCGAWPRACPRGTGPTKAEHLGREESDCSAGHRGLADASLLRVWCFADVLKLPNIGRNTISPLCAVVRSISCLDVPIKSKCCLAYPRGSPRDYRSCSLQ